MGGQHTGAILVVLLLTTVLSLSATGGAQTVEECQGPLCFSATNELDGTGDCLGLTGDRTEDQSLEASYDDGEREAEASARRFCTHQQSFFGDRKASGVLVGVGVHDGTTGAGGEAGVEWVKVDSRHFQRCWLDAYAFVHPAGVGDVVEVGCPADQGPVPDLPE